MLEVASSCKKEGILGRRTYLVFRTMLSGLKINSSLALHLLLGGKKKPAVKIQLCKSLKCGLFFSPQQICTLLLHSSLWLNLWIQGADYKVICGFSTAAGQQHL